MSLMLGVARDAGADLLVKRGRLTLQQRLIVSVAHNAVLRLDSFDRCMTRGAVVSEKGVRLREFTGTNRKLGDNLRALEMRQRERGSRDGENDKRKIKDRLVHCSQRRPKWMPDVICAASSAYIARERTMWNLSARANQRLSSSSVRMEYSRSTTLSASRVTRLAASSRTRGIPMEARPAANKCAFGSAFLSAADFSITPHALSRSPRAVCKRRSLSFRSTFTKGVR